LAACEQFSTVSKNKIHQYQRRIHLSAWTEEGQTRPQLRSAGLERIVVWTPEKFPGSAFLPNGHPMATKERLAAMAASLCALCSGVMVAKLVVPDPDDDNRKLRTYECAQCG
jgi:hypothetical protein